MIAMRNHAAVGIRIPKRCLRIALRINYIVHSGNCQRLHGRWLGSRGFADCRPKSGLQLGRPFGQLLALIVILVEVKLDPQARVLGKELADVCSIGGGKKIAAQYFSSNGVGFRLFEILALIITIGRHRKAEADDQAEQRQRSREDDTKMFFLLDHRRSDNGYVAMILRSQRLTAPQGKQRTKAVGSASDFP